MVRKVIVLGLGAALALSSIGSAFADSANWSEDKARQIEINRCANAGLGNGGEQTSDNGCGSVASETTRRDLDPGNSRDHNHNNDR